MKSEPRYRGTLQAEYVQQAWFARDSRNLTAITLVAATANYRALNNRPHRLRRRRVATRHQPRAKQLNAQSNKQRPEQKSAVSVLRLLD